MISTEKQTLRLAIGGILRNISPGTHAEKSARIAGHLRGLSGVILGFAPLRLEPDWTAAIGPDWQLALPRIEGRGLIFHRVEDFSELRAGAFGTREPSSGAVTLVAAADVILVPGVAFDRAGRRLGRGGGFYDRLLKEAPVRTRRVAVAFGCQLVERVPVEPHDIAVDAIVTEDGWIEARSSGRGRD